ncbi:ribosomal large subunit pseudouridine synthase F [Pontibacter ummariensis]|uniref:Ribosomal large subunit pseudouridine synthase F n=1 Tax=Pontibacter ummariensis TaxID=1610492 RepID=A0A239C2T9_9BACT|nr:pseudouridine synthase [Pontibacter ummariensis]PRY15492.1 ribosomal large subunit pseudouridine synthase F [Pontibacter ummariensis]SNS14212.1 ribosomal large subunit pseudouridine synthase F [Pontibacter ummariensis]
MEPKRLNKFISDSGFCSRREADKLIEEERVTVNGKLPEPGTKVTTKDKVRIDDQLLNVREEAPVFLLLNKPSGMSATADMGVRDNVVRAINHTATLQPIGFLERDSEGVLFLSNDTDLVRRLTKADNKFEKEYIVTVDKLISSDFIAKLIGGEDTEEGEKTQKTFIAKEGSTRFRIILKPGTNHNIKMLCERLGYNVVHLQRIRIESFTLAKLPPGHWRALTPAEVDKLRTVASSAVKNKVSGFSEDYRSYSSGPGKRIGKSRPAGAPKGGPGRKAGRAGTGSGTTRSTRSGSRTGTGRGSSGPKGTGRRGGR